MTVPVYADADYLDALQKLMPRGRAWPRDPDAVQTQTLSGLAKSFNRTHLAANDLLVDAFPATAFYLLPEWEKTLDLPDPCAGPAPTIQQRRAQVVARLANDGGQNAAYFIGYATNLGYEVTITEFAPFRCGQSRCGQPLGGEDWFYAWAINAPLNTITEFRMGESAVGEPLRSWGNAVLECELSAIAPAHSILLFQYS